MTAPRPCKISWLLLARQCGPRRMSKEPECRGIDIRDRSRPSWGTRVCRAGGARRRVAWGLGTRSEGKKCNRLFYSPHGGLDHGQGAGRIRRTSGSRSIAGVVLRCREPPVGANCGLLRRKKKSRNKSRNTPSWRARNPCNFVRELPAERAEGRRLGWWPCRCLLPVRRFAV